MNTQAFLNLVVPQDGFIITVAPTNTTWPHTFHTSVAQAVAHTSQLTLDKKNAYFALGSFHNSQSRTQANVKSLKALWLDLDVDVNDIKKFSSKGHALQELMAFCKRVGLPRPMLVDSGGGIHVYWPFTDVVPAADWKPVALKLKAITQHLAFHADQAVTADESRILRTVGGLNIKRGGLPVHMLSPAPRLYTLDELRTALNTFATNNNVAPSGTPYKHPIAGQPAGVLQANALPNNVGATSDPAHFDSISFACGQIGMQVACRGAGISEPLWHCGIGVAKFCDNPTLAATAISDGHAQYSASATQRKLDNWTATGPTLCEKFGVANPAVCDACQFKGQIKSPAQLGRTVREAPPIILVATPAGPAAPVEIPQPPAPYTRRAGGGVVVKSEDKDGNPTFEQVCPYDLYPLNHMHHDGIATNAHSQWRVHLPRNEVRDFKLSHTMLHDPGLAGRLGGEGIVLTNKEAKYTQEYMNRYLQTLAEQADSVKSYEHLGWTDDRKSFVLGKSTLLADGTVVPNIPSDKITGATHDGVHEAGTLDGWKQAIRFYAGPAYASHRIFLYAALGAPLFHMTGEMGMLMTARGDSGRGKTTSLKACASIWGNPKHLILNGSDAGTTMNALYGRLGIYHSLPFLLDDTTERDAEEIRKMMLNVSQGDGKKRMKGSELVPSDTSWETIMLSTANTDDLNRIMAGNKNVRAHQMRFIGIEFGLPDTGAAAKIKADQFIRDLHANYGHAGPEFMKAVLVNYDSVKAQVLKILDNITHKVGAADASADASAERFWLAATAAAYTAALIASRLKLIDFPIEQDLDHMLNLLRGQRTAINDATSTPQEQLGAMLNHYHGAALILSAKAASQLDGVVQNPVLSGPLRMRIELDTNTVFITRDTVGAYCTQHGIPFVTFERELQAAFVLKEHRRQVVLGAGVKIKGAAVRCWEIDLTKVGGAAALVPPIPAPAVSNVVPMRQKTP